MTNDDDDERLLTRINFAVDGGGDEGDDEGDDATDDEGDDATGDDGDATDDEGDENVVVSSGIERTSSSAARRICVTTRV